MQKWNESWETAAVDLHGLRLFRLVATSGGFTAAAARAGLTQSAVTRQIQGLEAVLGARLFERTTRRVRLTPAGKFLAGEMPGLLRGLDRVLGRLREDYAGARPRIRLGVSSTVGLAYLPGFLHAALRRVPGVLCDVSHRPGREILRALEAQELDLGIVCPPARIPQSLRLTHEFRDDFTLIAPRGSLDGGILASGGRRERARRLREQPWIVVSESSTTGRQLRAWLDRLNWCPAPLMELDDFDLIINLVALGLGVSLVPSRALALYRQKDTWRQIVLPEKFSRQLAVVVRRSRELPPHLADFMSGILF